MTRARSLVGMPSPAGPISYTWDDNGNLTDRGSDEFSWDYEDRMVEATVNSVTTSFAYRGDGLRDSRTVGANTTTFTWDVAFELPLVLEDGSREYVYGAGLVSMKQSGNWYYYLADGLGSTMAVVDSSGTSQKSYQYDVYGEVTGGSGSLANEIDFAGQQTDGTGLQYLRARYYDPETGTFLSRDPLAHGPAWRNSHYAYASANPIGRIDPTGLEDNLYGDSTKAERDWCYGGLLAWTRIEICADGRALANVATQLTKEYFGYNDDNTPSNAFKHCCWIGMFALYHGNKEAKSLGDRHEKLTPEEFRDRASRVSGGAGRLLRMAAMDVHNNAMGRRYADQARRGGGTIDDQVSRLIQSCKDGVASGQLINSPDDARTVMFGGPPQ